MSHLMSRQHSTHTSWTMSTCLTNCAMLFCLVTIVKVYSCIQYVITNHSHIYAHNFSRWNDRNFPPADDGICQEHGFLLNLKMSMRRKMNFKESNCIRNFDQLTNARKTDAENRYSSFCPQVTAVDAESRSFTFRIWRLWVGIGFEKFNIPWDCKIVSQLQTSLLILTYFCSDKCSEA